MKKLKKKKRTEKGKRNKIILSPDPNHPTPPFIVDLEVSISDPIESNFNL